MTRVILASRSPRRSDLLKMLGIRHDIIPSSVPEEALPGERAEAQVIRLAIDKARAVAASAGEGDLVISADTLVEIGETVLGQPTSDQEASRMIEMLSGNTHEVLTGICLLRKGSGKVTGLSRSDVTFYKMSPSEIEWYISTREPMDKAGAYAAQGIGAVFLKHIEGSYHNVVGFPVDLFYRLLPEVGLDMRDIAASDGDTHG